MERREILFGILTPYLEARGYQPYLTGGDPSYTFTEEEIVVSFFFNFRSNGEIVSGPLSLTNYLVEDYILRVGTPNDYVKVYSEKKKYHPVTISLRKLPKSLDDRIYTSQDDILRYADLYINFLENEGEDFIQQYRYLPNVLNEMDKLEAGGKYWNEILSGGPEHLFKGLIISRLCNDKKFLLKFDWLETVFKTMDLDQWQPYWDKLKLILPTINPAY